MKQQNIKFLFALFIGLMSVNSSAHNIEVKNADGVTIYYNYINNKTELAVTYQGSSYYSYKEYTGDLVIPEFVTYNGTTYSVTSIGGSAFRGCTGLTNIYLSNSVTDIGSEADWNELANKVQVYPNPVNAGERFSIGMAGDVTDIVRVEIVNALGVVTTSYFV